MFNSETKYLCALGFRTHSHADAEISLVVSPWLFAIAITLVLPDALKCRYGATTHEVLYTRRHPSHTLNYILYTFEAGALLGCI